MRRLRHQSVRRDRNHRSHCADRPAADQRAAAAGASRTGAALAPPALASQFDGTKFKASPSIRSEEHTSELQSLMRISYAVFCLQKKKSIKTYDDPQRDEKHIRSNK